MAFLPRLRTSAGTLTGWALAGAAVWVMTIAAMTPLRAAEDGAPALAIENQTGDAAAAKAGTPNAIQPDTLQPDTLQPDTLQKSTLQKTTATAEGAGTADLTMEQFLDRLMRAESGGRATAKNPRSTALGPYQFIASTWLLIANKHFTKETDKLRADQVLALRTDHDLSRRAAELYTHQNAAYLVAQGQTPTFAHLRLAFLVGAGGAVRVLSAPPDTPASDLLGASVIGANPFMAKLTAAGLIARARRDIDADPASIAGVTPDAALVQQAALGGNAAAPKRRRVAVACDLSLPSCRRWLALAERRIKKQRRASN
ncbi:MAG: hypothetical protein ABL907_14610 [Hyphomicrobium sp.]